MSRVLVIAAHPDDEVLGCGGTLARHAALGDVVHVVFLTDGVSARGEDKAQALRRRKAAERAAEVLGVSDLILGAFPDNRVDSHPLLEIVQAIEPFVHEYQPEIIYSHHAGDLNVDHALAHRAVVTACRPLQESQVRLIASFEVLSSTEWASPSAYAAFVPRMFVDISQFMERKVEALRCYEEEMRPSPHPRSEEAVRALAVFRGAAAGCEAAEAFDVVRLRFCRNQSLPP